MFKPYVIDPAFHTVELLSKGLKHLLGGNGSDLAAGWVMLACLLIIIGIHARLVRGWSLTRLGAVLALILLPLLSVDSIVRLAGHEVVKIDRGKIRPAGGFASRIRLKDDVLKRLDSRRWTVVETRRSRFALPSFQPGPRQEASHAMKPVMRDGGGKFFLKEAQLYVSSRFDAGSTTTFWLVIEKPWKANAERMAPVAVKSVTILLLASWLAWLVIRPFMPELRQPAFLIIAAAFALYYGSHQMRFLSHDHRMQMTTSRDDDGYMMERLDRAGTPPTMDPLPLGNNAYGAVAYYSFAALPAAGGYFGFPVSLSTLNAFVRGIKVLSSLLMIAGVWVLARRHFGRMEALVAILFTATFAGFLKYSSYPFYPDVLMAAFALFAVTCSLDLIDGWSDRSFILATICAAISVSVKFISFLVFPFLMFCIGWAVWMKPAALPAEGRVPFIAKRAACFLVVSVAAFFLCNPYLDYNIEWIVPNMTSVQNLYTAATPLQVVAGPASLPEWLTSAYCIVGNDYSLPLALALSLSGLVFLTAGWLTRRPLALRPLNGSGPASFNPVKSTAVLLLAVCWNLYLFSSITLPGAIDERLVLAIYPLFLAVAAQVAGLLFLSLRRSTAGFRQPEPGGMP